MFMPFHETRVEVRDEAGKPVAGAKVEGLVDFGQRLPSFIAEDTDESGKTRLWIPEGIRIHDVIALKQGVGFDYFGNQSTTFGPIRLTTDAQGVATIRRSTRPLTYLATSTDRKLGASQEWLQLDPNTHDVTILMRPTRKVTGRFLDKSGKPLEKCRIVCQTTRTIPIATDDGSNTRLMLSNDPTIEVTTDDQGRFGIEDLIPGVGYEITAWKWLDEYERSMRVATKTIDVSIGETVETIECGDIRGRY
jgi:hypothetical protein